MDVDILYATLSFLLLYPVNFFIDIIHVFMGKLKYGKQIHIMLVLSTLPHLLCILPLLQVKHAEYIRIVLVSTTFSTMYHAHKESHPMINALDYTMAFIWFLYDASYWDAQILAANIGSFLAHIAVPLDASYPFYHSIWHLLNAWKCYYVSLRIGVL